jgi:peptidoglycan/LPS O-acetylase OafA/YrhL
MAWLSVTLVILGHLIGFHFFAYLTATPFHLLLAQNVVNRSILIENIILRLLIPLPLIGVDIFFIISGYLITTILLTEEIKQGSISITAFYIRRVFRIIPAFYVFLITMFILSSFGMVTIPASAFITSGLFLCNVQGASCTWWLGHTWTLAVEEQFYLVWPLVFVLLPSIRRSAGLVSILVILLAMSFFYPIAVSFMHIATGALFASCAAFRRAIMRSSTPRLIIIATIIIFCQPFAASRPLILWIIEVAGPILLALIFFGTINGVGPFVRMVSAEGVRRIGLVSYSLYLWQQLSTGASDWYSAYAVMPVLLVGPAVISYMLIERPMIRVGHRLSKSITDRRTRSAVRRTEIA